MMRLIFTVAVFVGFLGPASAQTAQFTIDLVAHTAKESTKVQAAYPALQTKPSPRAVLTASADAPITVKWTVRNLEPGATVKDVLIHFFVVKQEKPDQQEVPKLTKNVVVESALTMDFRPQDKTGGEITFTVANPGSYLLRLELKGVTAKDGREPFAALDLTAR